MPIRHVVMWSLHDPADADVFKAELDSCIGLVPGILQFEVGVRQPGLEGNCDVMLLSLFADRAALDAYQKHPHHQAVSARVGPLRRERHVLDTFIESPPP